MQRFKLNIANSVVTQQNAGLSSMDTEFVLDLFKRNEENGRGVGKRREKESSGPLKPKGVLQHIGDLPSEEEYQGLDLAHFMESLGSGEL